MMKTTPAIFLGLMAFPVLPGGAQVVISQNKPPSVTPPALPTFQIDGPGIRCPGRYPIKEGYSLPLYSVLYLAGGFIGFTKQEQIRIVRPKPTKALTFTIDATDPEVLLKFQVQAGDQVTVPVYRPIGDFFEPHLLHRP